jgi:hypothetical protein
LYGIDNVWRKEVEVVKTRALIPKRKKNYPPVCAGFCIVKREEEVKV